MARRIRPRMPVSVVCAVSAVRCTNAKSRCRVLSATRWRSNSRRKTSLRTCRSHRSIAVAALACAGTAKPHVFIDEAQPKNRAEAVSMSAAKEIAEGIRPQEITGSATAYTARAHRKCTWRGNPRHNRSDALRFLWENKLPQQQQTYKQYLLDNAEQFGIDPRPSRPCSSLSLSTCLMWTMQRQSVWVR